MLASIKKRSRVAGKVAQQEPVVEATPIPVTAKANTTTRPTRQRPGTIYTPVGVTKSNPERLLSTWRLILQIVQTLIWRQRQNQLINIQRRYEPFIAALAAAMRAAQMSRVAQTAKNVGSVTKTGLKEGIEQSAGGDNGGGNTKRSVDAAEAEDAVDKRGLASFLSKVFRIGGKAGKELAQEGASRAAENAASGNGDQNQSQKRSFEPVARSPNSNKALGRKIGKAVVESQRSGASEAMARPGMLSYATVGLAVAVAVGAFNVAL